MPSTQPLLPGNSFTQLHPQTSAVCTTSALFGQNVLPQLNKTLDAFSSLTGEMNGLLTTVPSSADQIDNLLDQMSAGLSNTVTALEGTKPPCQMFRNISVRFKQT